MPTSMSRDDPNARPDAVAAATRHDEWLMDEGIRGSFPASDPASSSQPGSLVNERYAARERTAAPRGSNRTMFWWLLAGGAIFCLAFVAGRGRRRRA